VPNVAKSRRVSRGIGYDYGLMRRLAGAVLRRALRRPLDSIAVLLAVVLSLVIVVNALFLQSGRHPAPMLHARARHAPHDTTGALARMIPRPRPPELTRATVAPPAEPLQPPTPAARRGIADTIIRIQKELAIRGFYDGTPDGIWGPKTDAAARAFAERAGVKGPVEAGEPLLKLIAHSPIKATPVKTAAVKEAPVPAPAAPSARDTLTASDTALPSPRVMAVQRALADYGYGQIKPTGIEDAPTRAAIAAFERDHNMPPTGRMSAQLVRELSTLTGRPLE
jgi:peptidoglycan hydrolase-like protein with peptidoglycan-binding domain